MVEIEKSAARVAVIGTGAIGSAVVRRLLDGGHEVTVYNRTRSRAARLVAAGALRARSLREAVLSSPLVLLTLKDYAAVQQCLAHLDVDLSGRTIVGMYTGTAGEARQAAERVASLGARYVGAGIQVSPEVIGTDTATILYSGSRHAFEQHESVFELLGRPRLVGEAPEAAAVWDLALFGVWYDAQLGLLRALDTVREAGIDVEEFARTANTQLDHVVAAVPATVSEMLHASYPAGPANLTEHLAVVRHLVELRAGGRLGDGGLPEVAARIEALIAAGRGTEGLTAIVGRRSAG
ncbi:NAD(P)-dependent oxidoreductase [Saccharothrix syringae]|uniref:NAD(P)-dependent oxidoreductase n=1 Tax=Saccharothrix syringae TaxID=103733 RepID=A0A5Q0GXR0_SACSY|nr:NAD(P)-binding domain-containing protein [Saccharothrix syringae]QFZ18683.1 NAD(P)-dependent oxidoreductase [Saccharothrix syringae]